MIVEEVFRLTPPLAGASLRFPFRGGGPRDLLAVYFVLISNYYYIIYNKFYFDFSYYIN